MVIQYSLACKLYDYTFSSLNLNNVSMHRRYDKNPLELVHNDDVWDYPVQSLCEFDIQAAGHSIVSH